MKIVYGFLKMNAGGIFIWLGMMKQYFITFIL